MIPDFKTYLKESVWGDIRRRAEGVQDRKENDIDLLDLEGLFQYMKDHYGLYDGLNITKYEPTETLLIPVFNKGGTSGIYQLYVENFKDPEKKILELVSPRFISSDDLLYAKIREKYKLLTPKYNYDKNVIIAKDEHTPATNSFVLDVLDFIIDNITDTRYKILIYKR